MEILNTTTELTGIAWWIGFPGIFGSMTAISMLIIFLSNKNYKNALFTFIILVLCIFSFKFAYVPYYNSPKGHYVYHEVLLKDGEKIDESIYKIKEQKGKITVIQELHPKSK
jgi:hypothetical protein